MEGWLIFIGAIGAIWFIVWLNNRLSDLREKAVKYVRLKPMLDNLEAELDSYKAELKSREWELQSNKAELGSKDEKLTQFEAELASYKSEQEKLKLRLDTALIEEERLECYVETVEEAEALGFRHAYRWKGQSSDKVLNKG